MFHTPFYILTCPPLLKNYKEIGYNSRASEAQFYASEKKVLELTKKLHEEQTLNAYIAPKRMRTTFLS